ncbi:MAG: P-type conjugative transfer protein VirB9 [Rickettsiales endosymbiont of Dermacentor nuttalli]
MAKQVLSFCVCLVLLVTAIMPAYATREAKPMAIDSRIKVIVYNPDDVFKYVGYYGYQANIEFSESEVIDNISLGDTIAWQIVPSGRRIFLKPMEPEATTNMTVITNKRVYYFELHAKNTDDIEDPDIAFNVRFLYPDESGGEVVRHFTVSAEPDLSEPENYNFNYTISGSNKISPIKIFDDSDFTYFQFREKNTEIPAFFIVDSDGNEGIVNYRVSGKYIVVERIAPRFTLRLGNDVVCVFNEAIPFDTSSSKGKKNKK